MAFSKQMHAITIPYINVIQTEKKNRLSTYVIFWLPVHFVCICDFDLSLMAWLGLVLMDGRTTSTTTTTAITYHPDPTETYFHFFGLDTQQQ